MGSFERSKGEWSRGFGSLFSQAEFLRLDAEFDVFVAFGVNIGAIEARFEGAQQFVFAKDRCFRCGQNFPGDCVGLIDEAKNAFGRVVGVCVFIGCQALTKAFGLANVEGRSFDVIQIVNAGRAWDRLKESLAEAVFQWLLWGKKP